MSGPEGPEPPVGQAPGGGLGSGGPGGQGGAGAEEGDAPPPLENRRPIRIALVPVGKQPARPCTREILEDALRRAEEFERSAPPSEAPGARPGDFVVPQDLALPRFRGPSPADCLPPELRRAIEAPSAPSRPRHVFSRAGGGEAEAGEGAGAGEGDDDEPPPLESGDEEPPPLEAAGALVPPGSAAGSWGLESLVFDLESAFISLAVAWQSAGLLAAFRVCGLALIGWKRWAEELRARACGSAVIGLDDFGEAAVELDFAGNALGGLDPEQTSELSKAFRDDSLVTSLSLANCGLVDRSMAWLRSAIMSNATLTQLTLSQNEIGDDGASGLAMLLEKKATLTSLDVGHNRIGSKGAARLAAALKKNRTLKELDLRFNKIQDDGAIQLSEALTAAAKTSLLVTLNLMGNPIGDQGEQEMALVFDELSLLEKWRLEALCIGDRRLTRSGPTPSMGGIKPERFILTCSPDGTSVGGA